MGEADRCFEKKLLEPSRPSIGLAIKSLKQAKSFLADAEDMIRFGKDRMGIIAVYDAFFHAARSLLFRDGIKERSHYCVARYLEEKYVAKGLVAERFLNNLDAARDMRHESQYSLDDFVLKADLGAMVAACKEFISAVGKMLA